MPSAQRPVKPWFGTERPVEADYGRWLQAVHGVDLEAERTRYISAAALAEKTARTGSLWTEFRAQRSDLEAVYFEDTGYGLFAFSVDQEPSAKPWASFLNKSYRSNVLRNASWPDPPEGGWLLPSSWLVEIHDVIRTVLVVKYLDGVKYLTEALAGIAAATSYDFESNLEARDTGYYAAHTYSHFNASVPASDFRYTETLPLSLEVQITTQLQEVMTRLTHEQYEVRRSRPSVPAEKWQWDPQSSEFQPNYLGHLLHYAEGMIMEVRDRGRR